MSLVILEQTDTQTTSLINKEDFILNLSALLLEFIPLDENIIVQLLVSDDLLLEFKDLKRTVPRDKQNLLGAVQSHKMEYF